MRARYLNEELVHSYIGQWSGKSIDIYKNPGSIRRFNPSVRAISDLLGNIWVTDMENTTHSEIIKELYKLGEINFPSYYGYKLEMVYCGWQRKETTNDFYIAESFTTYDMEKNISRINEFAEIAGLKHPQFNFIVQRIF